MKTNEKEKCFLERGIFFGYPKAGRKEGEEW
jgi:hypothetical protein